MANETYTLIQKTTLNASAASITFSSIPQTFTDLVIRASARGTRAELQSNFGISFNGLTTDFTGKYLEAGGTSAYSASAARFTGSIPAANATANVFGNYEMYIPNYTSANYKSFSTDSVSENNGTEAYKDLTAGLWSSTAAITSITISLLSGGDTLTQYSSFALYGVAKQGVNPVAGPKASGGDIITNDGTYWIHQFLNSGTFTPTKSFYADYVVVAGAGGGGGKGGGNGGGGGGAGGLRSTVTATGGGGSLESALSLTAQAYTVTIGAGGTGGQSVRGTNGNNSVFSTITSTGGGVGGGAYPTNDGIGSAGGSGGGGSQGNFAGGAASPAGQGNAGGLGEVTAGNYRGGGGGGAGVAGATGLASGAGGAGAASNITGTSVTLGGGGGAGADSNYGAGGSGGGGAGAYPTGVAGSANTGGGGGGGSGGAGTVTGGAGGSGIVIIRYTIA